MLLAGACSEDEPEDVGLVSRVPHDVAPLLCDDDVSWTFSNIVERATVISGAFEILELEGTSCEAELRDVTFRDADGRTALATGFAPISNQTMTTVWGAVQCGGAEFDANQLGGELETDEVQAVTVSFDDDTEAVLTREASAFVDGMCYEETGSWVGTAGSLDGQSGAYRWVEDELQIDLALSNS